MVLLILLLEVQSREFIKEVQLFSTLNVWKVTARLPFITRCRAEKVKVYINKEALRHASLSPLDWNLVHKIRSYSI